MNQGTKKAATAAEGLYGQFDFQARVSALKNRPRVVMTATCRSLAYLHFDKYEKYVFLVILAVLILLLIISTSTSFLVGMTMGLAVPALQYIR
jgi:hypothetical protein